MTTVIFRKDKLDGEIIAVFPYMVEYKAHEVGCYVHIGQHSACSFDYYYARTKPATSEEYADLKSELESIGYTLKVTKRINYNKYLLEYNKLHNNGN